jgi:hypothetical protein
MCLLWGTNWGFISQKTAFFNHYLIQNNLLLARVLFNFNVLLPKKNSVPKYSRELYWPNGCRWSAKLVSTFVGAWLLCSQRNGSPLPFICVFQTGVATSHSSSSLIIHTRAEWTPLQTPLLLKYSGGVGNRKRDSWIWSQELWHLDHRGGFTFSIPCPFIYTSPF